MSFDTACNGTTHRTSWMDDSYSCGSLDPYPCPGYPQCKSKAVMAARTKEVPMEDHGREPHPLQDHRPTVKSTPSVALTVSIPVKVGGYTGQRDQWEEHTVDYAVSLTDGVVELIAPGNIQRKIVFDRAGLEAALKVLEDYTSNKGGPRG